MKVIRLAGLMLIAVLGMSLVATSAANAGLYLFLGTSVGKLFLGLSLVSTLTAGKNRVVCTDDHNEGTIANVHLIGPFSITFLGCKSTANFEADELCSANSVGEAVGSGVIATKTLHGLLGLVLPESTDLAGLLVLPTADKVFVEIEKNACTVATSPEGSVAGLLVANQLGHLVLESLINFIPKDITKIDTLNGSVEPKLLAFGLTAEFATVEHLIWDGDIQVEVV